jgi:hypothetical protein
VDPDNWIDKAVELKVNPTLSFIGFVAIMMSPLRVEADEG